MNKRNILSILFILATLAFTLSACVKGELDEPPVNIPKVDFDTVPRYHKSISDLLIQYPGACDSIKDTIYISGIVTANDESGNLYKYIVIQDETAGLQLSIDQASLYADFRVGQRVVIKCRGMYLGRYNELPQLGYIYNGKIGRLPATLMRDHFFLDSLPNKANLPAPLLLTPTTQLDATMVNRLVRFENVSFADAGSLWADPAAAGDRKLEGGTNPFVVRTSNYASFATMPIPSGTGTIQGILGRFGSTYQLALRDTNDIIGFQYIPTYLRESFASGLGDFTVMSVTGTQQWGYDASYFCAKMTGYSGGANFDNEDWLISPTMNLSNATNAVLSFFHAIKYGDIPNMAVNQSVWISKNYISGNPTLANWEQLTVPTYPAPDFKFVSSGEIGIPASYIGQTNVRVAFKYLSNTSNSSTWEIQNVKVTE